MLLESESVMQMPQWIQNLKWDRQKTIYMIVGLLALLLVYNLFFREGDEKEQARQGAPVPQGTQQAASPTQTTLLEDFEFIAGVFPELQLNAGATPMSVVVDQGVLDERTTQSLKDAAAKKIEDFDGKKFKEMELEGPLTIMLDEQGESISLFLVVVKGVLEDDKPFPPSRIFLSDSTWTAQRSLELAKQIRRDIEEDPNSIRVGGGGHRIHIGVRVPVYRPVN